MTTTLQTSGRQITGDVISDAGKIAVEGDLTIDGSVRDNVDIKATGAVSISGAVEAANIGTRNTITIAGGILGKNKGLVRADQGVTAKFCSAATIISNGDITMQTECVNSDLSTRACVKLPEGIISGGRVIGNAGVICKTLGSTAGAPTEIGAGFYRAFDESVCEELARLKAILSRSAEIKSKVEPLMKNQKALTPAQKEKAIELLYEASESEQQAKSAIAAMKRSIDEVDAMAKSEIIVTGIIHANVTIRFRGYEAMIKQDIRGPLKISLATSQSPPAICVAEIEEGKTGSLFYLETKSRIDPTAEARNTIAKLA